MTKISDKSLVPTLNSKLSTLFGIVINGALLSGCSMMSSEPETVVKSELEQQLESYTELEPEIRRILALESDMQIIVSELARYSALGNDPLATTSPENNSEKNVGITANNSKAKTRNCSTESNAVSGHCSMKIGLHIAAFRDEKFLLPGWFYLEKKLPAELTEGKRPLSTEIVQQDISYQSLRVGPFSSVYHAKAVCEQASHLVSCAVVEYRGKNVGS
jgi:hypothetical protein